MGSEHYCLRWNNHQSNLLGVFSQLLRDESLVDVTLACSEGTTIRAHKVVLSACSSYFQTLFVDHPSRHPIVILKDVRFSELRTLVEFMYKGEVNVEYCQLSALLKTAESLKVKGLAEMTNLGSTREEQQDTEQDLERDNELCDSKETVNKRLVAKEEPETCPLRPTCVSPVGPLPLHRRLDGQTNDRPASTETMHPDSPDSELTSAANSCGPSDMSLNNNSTVTSCLTSALPGGLLGTVSSICPRLPSPNTGEPVAGPSGLPPVQQVPLSLKKEIDWSAGNLKEEKNIGECSSEYRHPHESKMLGCGDPLMDLDTGSPRLYPCMYCGMSFPHQSKLTRHILSHSLESLKYRELQHHHLAMGGGLSEPLHLMESHFSGGRPPPAPHELMSAATDPPDHHGVHAMELAELTDGGGGGCGGGGVVLCKFCGKSFPDVGSLISHLPVHTGDRPFKCEFCGKAFKLRHHMKDHCRVHTGERPFRCALCGKTFSRSTILKAHEKTHYPKYVRKFLSPSPLDAEEESPH